MMISKTSLINFGKKTTIIKEEHYMTLDESRNYHGFDFSNLYTVVQNILSDYEKDQENSEDDKKAKAKSELKQEENHDNQENNTKNSSSFEEDNQEENPNTLKNTLYEKFKRDQDVISAEYAANIIIETLNNFNNSEMPSYELSDFYKNNIGVQAMFDHDNPGVCVTIYNLKPNSIYNSIEFKTKLIETLKKDELVGFDKIYVSYYEDKIFVNLVF